MRFSEAGRKRFVGLSFAQGLFCAVMTLGLLVGGGRAAFGDPLHVRSTPVTGISIAGTPSGTTDYNVNVDSGANVDLTAPESHVSGGQTYVFVRWSKDSVAQPLGQRTLNFDISGNTFVTAEYELLQWDLDVRSTPVTGVTIASSTGHGGVTDYNLPGVDNEAQVILSAPPTTVSGDTAYDFVRWTLNGVDQALGNAELIFNIDQDSVAVAEYLSVGPATLVRIWSYRVPGENVPISSGTGHACNTNTDMYVYPGSWMVLTAPATFEKGQDGYRFVRWWYNGYPIANRTINFAANAMTWAVVEYESVPVWPVDVMSYNLPGGNVHIDSSTGHDGNTNYELDLAESTWVALTAPSIAYSGLDPYRFVRWWYNGYPIANRTINFAVSGDTTAVAEYEPAPVYTVYVWTYNLPGDNAAIASPTGHDGDTNYDIELPASTWVVLRAPRIVDSGGTDYRFVRWWVNGYPIANTTINFAMSSDVTAVAEYAPPAAASTKATLKTGIVGPRYNAAPEDGS